MKTKNEVAYYPEIQRFIEAQLKSNFLAKNNRELNVFWGIGELKSNLNRIINENPGKCECARMLAQNVPPLNLDIFALITDTIHYELLIIEVKLMQSVGLKEWSQLVGYCLVSDAKYGILLNINKGASPRLSEILGTKDYISNMANIIREEKHSHYLGFMQWDSLTQCFDYSNLGYIRSLSHLSKIIADEFSK